LDDYLAAFSRGVLPERSLDETISPVLGRAETVILGLRLDSGVAAAAIDDRHRQIVSEMTGLGLMEYSAGNVRLTRRGRLLSNEVFWRFLPEEQSVVK
jgi:oxygen-independent coproporphyrinogen-3 oxidase